MNPRVIPYTPKTDQRMFNETISYLSKKRRENIEKTRLRPVIQEIILCLFFVLILFIDVFIPLEIYRFSSTPLTVVLSIFVLFLFFYVEIRVYIALWGKKGRWAVEKYTQKTRSRTQSKGKKV